MKYNVAEWFLSTTQKLAAQKFLSTTKYQIAKPVKFGLTIKNANTVQNATGKKFANQNVATTAALSNS